MSIASALDGIRHDIASACRRSGRDPAAIRLIAVTKNQDPSVIPYLVAAGIEDIGENRIEHHAMMHAHASLHGVRIHAIGRIQGRQLQQIVPISAALHSLADVGHIERLARACPPGPSPFPVFVQVNTSGEASKAGLPPGDLPRMLAQCRPHADQFRVVGLMTMAPLEAPETAIRSTFRSLRRLAEDQGLERLSMGMSEDFPIAVEEGATDIRIGTRIFTS